MKWYEDPIYHLMCKKAEEIQRQICFPMFEPHLVAHNIIVVGGHL